MHCASSVWLMDVMVLGSYKFPSSASSSSSISSISPSQSKPFPVSASSSSSSCYSSEITPPHHRPLPHLTKLHLGSTILPSCIPSTLSQPQLASSPVQTLSCLFHPDDAAECCESRDMIAQVRSNQATPDENLHLLTQPYRLRGWIKRLDFCI